MKQIKQQKENTSNSLKEFEPSLDSAFDQSIAKGRILHFAKIVNPLNFFTTPKTLKEYQNILKKSESDSSIKEKYSNEELWRMKYCNLSNIHPQTGEVIPYPFRTSGYVLMNTPINFALACIPPTPFNQIASQSFNQAFNFCFNYYNRNVSNTYSKKELALSFTGAITAAIAGSLGTAAISRRITFNKTFSSVLKATSPFMGVAIANVCNLAFSRYQDFSKGIVVSDLKTGEEIKQQNSIIAAKKAFWQTAASRVIIPIPVFLLPIGGSRLLKHYNLYPKTTFGGSLLGIGLSAVGLMIGSIIGFSAFEQQYKIHVKQLEPAFHNLKNKDGKKIEYVTYNKGL